ncbi:hypothetical protein PPACK8108_LOCUS23400, partial [Phakopsora pachyrhizi]
MSRMPTVWLIFKVKRSLVLILLQQCPLNLQRSSCGILGNYHSIDLPDDYKPRQVAWDYSAQFISVKLISN